MVLRDTGLIVGSVGFVSCMGPYGQLPALAAGGSVSRLSSTEFGLYWSISPRYQRRGFIGMRIERNPLPDPPWFQVVVLVTNPASVDAAPTAMQEEHLPER